MRRFSWSDGSVEPGDADVTALADGAGGAVAAGATGWDGAAAPEPQDATESASSNRRERLKRPSSLAPHPRGWPQSPARNQGA